MHIHGGGAKVGVTGPESNVPEVITEGAQRLVTMISMLEISPLEVQRFIAGYMPGSPSRLEKYDNSDLVFRRALQYTPPLPIERNWTPGQVDFCPIPTHCLLDLIMQAGIEKDDVVADLGSGPGLSACQFRILTGAHVVACDYQRDYIEAARDLAARNGLHGIECVLADVRNIDYTRATVFHLFHPFKSPILEEVVEKIKVEAMRRVVRVTSLGGCTRTFLGESWLKPLDEHWQSRDAVFEPLAFKSI